MAEIGGSVAYERDDEHLSTVSGLVRQEGRQCLYNSLIPISDGVFYILRRRGYKHAMAHRSGRVGKAWGKKRSSEPAIELLTHPLRPHAAAAAAACYRAGRGSAVAVRVSRWPPGQPREERGARACRVDIEGWGSNHDNHHIYTRDATNKM